MAISEERIEIARQAIANEAQGISQAETAEQLGIDKRRVWNAVKDYRKQQEPEYDPRVVPKGHTVKGLSTLTREDGTVVAQWVKTDRERETREQILERIINQLPRKVTPRLTSVKRMTQDTASEDLLTVYPMGDPHLGLYASMSETGEAWDLKRAINIMKAAIDELTTRTPATHAAHIINIGDFFHTDTSANRSKSGHVLDVDGKQFDILNAGFNLIVYYVDRALEHHGHVTLHIKQGNHDEYSSYAIAISLAAYYQNDPRVDVPLTAQPASYIEWGSVLIGMTHGDTYKHKMLPMLMANDMRAAWSKTRYQYWITGHIHHVKKEEVAGVIIESIRTLAARDAWHHAQGYRAGRDMMAIVYSKSYGEQTRFTVSADALLDRIAQEAATEGTQARQDAA